jgi:polysaccharide pyruvyl transferase WcaK-like protein
VIKGGFFLKSLRVHVIHVGNMNNRGAEMLLKSDIALVRQIAGDRLSMSVSTTDSRGVTKLGLPLSAVISPVIDIPYERADSFATRHREERRSWMYKVASSAFFVNMLVQAVLSVFSAVSVKVGLNGFYRSEVLKRIKNCDLVVSCSDENFKEGSSFLPLNVYWLLTWWSIMFSRMWDILISKFYGKPVIMLPNSMGPFKTRVGRLLSKIALGMCDFLLIRDPVSYRMVESLNIQTSRVLTYDTSFLFDSGERSSEDNVSSALLIGISAGVYSFTLHDDEISRSVRSYAEALDRAVVEVGATVVFFPHYISGFEYDDLEFSELIIEKMENKKKAKIVKVRNAEELKSSLGKMSLVVSSKMHPCTLALSNYVPTVCIAYDHKQTGLFESLGMLECIVPIRQLSGEELYSKIACVLGNRQRITAELRNKIPWIRRNVKEAGRLALTSASQ